MPLLVNLVRREVVRLKAISRKLSEIKYAPLHDETDQMGVIVSAMLKKLESRSDLNSSARALRGSSESFPLSHDDHRNRM